MNGSDEQTQLQPCPPQLDPSEDLPAVPGFYLHEEIGRGGMGVVYSARDTTLQRDVAVKILHNRYPADGPAAQRFVEESQITSQLQHPGVPPIHQVGALADGRPFLAMKLIRGHTLDKLLKGRATLAEDRGRFVACFEKVCEAVGYAHSRGVLHRDLKPANVMIGAFGEVQVMDWGLAKALGVPRPDETSGAGAEQSTIELPREPGSSTQAGSVLGTPAFMAPEQAAGEIARTDARSDAFGLGAVLCCVLTGQPPYVGSNVEAVRQMAIRGQLADAMERLNACGAEPELVALCKRCLSVEPGERPKDGAELAAIVAGFRGAAEERARKAELDRVRVEGARAKAEAEAREQRKRRKVQLALAVAVLLLVCGGAAFGWYSDRRETERRFKAEQVRLGIDAGLRLASDLREQHKFGAARKALAQAAELAGDVPERRATVEQARRDLALVEQLDEIRYRKWLWVLDERGGGKFDFKSAPPQYRQALADRGLDLESLDPTDAAQKIAASDVKAELVAAVDDWALCERDTAVQNRLLEIARKADPGPWTDRLRDPAVRKDTAAVAKLATDADLITATPATLSVLGELMHLRGLDPAAILNTARVKRSTDFELAFACGQAAKSDAEGVGPFEAARALRPDNPVVWNNLGNALYARGDRVGAIAAYVEAVRLNPRLSRAHFNLGNVLYAERDIALAIEAYTAAIRLEPSYAPAHYNLGLARVAQGDREGALAAYREAIRLDPTYVQAHNNLADLLSTMGNLDGALVAWKATIRLDPSYAPAYYAMALALRARPKKSKGDWDADFNSTIATLRETVRIAPCFPNAYYNLAVTLADVGDREGAIAAYRAAIRCDRGHVQARNNLGGLLGEKEDLKGAIEQFQEVVWLDPQNPVAHTNLGLARARGSEDVEGAIVAYKAAIRLDPNHARAYAELGNALWMKGNRPAAITTLREATRRAPDSPLAHSRLGNALKAMSDWEGAGAAYENLLRLNPKDAQTHYNLGFVALQQGNHQKAIACAQNALRETPKHSNAHELLVRALQESGDITGARSALTEAARIDPKRFGQNPKLPLPVAPAPREK